jgi:uncharacterized protein YdhG (YjbR/CyaY superfamily)
MQSKATSVEQYLSELPDERRPVVETVLALVRKKLPQGYRESIDYGGICWSIPLEVYPDTYNGQPLCYAALAAQKNHYALYLMGAYADPKQAEALRAGFAKAGKKLDMGKSCIRFRKLDDLALDAVAKAIAALPPKKYIALAEANRAKGRTKSRA